jgi:hypothetical protein
MTKGILFWVRVYHALYMSPPWQPLQFELSYGSRRQAMIISTLNILLAVVLSKPVWMQ